MRSYIYVFIKCDFSSTNNIRHQFKIQTFYFQFIYLSDFKFETKPPTSITLQLSCLSERKPDHKFMRLFVVVAACWCGGSWQLG